MPARPTRLIHASSSSPHTSLSTSHQQHRTCNVQRNSPSREYHARHRGGPYSALSTRKAFFETKLFLSFSAAGPTRPHFRLRSGDGPRGGTGAPDAAVAHPTTDRPCVWPAHPPYEDRGYIRNFRARSHAPRGGAPPGRKICSEAPSGFGVGPGRRPKGPPWRVDSGPSLLASYVVFSS